MDSRKRGLLKNTGILMIGNFSTKILSFLLVPLYTYYLLPSDYGKVDLYLTFLSMAYIIVSLQSIESSFRFIQDCKSFEEEKYIITNAFVTALSGVFFFSIIMFIYSVLFDFKYGFIFIAHVTTSIFSNQFLHTLRGMNKTISYVTISVISTIISALSNIILVVGIGMGSFALLLTPIIVNIVMIIMILLKEKYYRYIDYGCIKVSIINQQLKFSLPLIPNAISLWLLSSIGRFVLVLFYDTEAVGLLSFTLKFPALLGTISGIFHMAWQVSAISQVNDDDKDNFASEVFNQYASLQLTAIILMLPALKILILTIMGEMYKPTWIYVPIFLVGEVVRSFSEFLNAGFYSKKETSSIFKSSLIAAIIYFSISITIVKPLYILGVGIAYSLSEIIRFIYVAIKVSPYMKVSINKSKLIPISITAIIYGVFYYLIDVKLQFVLFVTSLIMAALFNRSLVKQLFIRFKP